MRTFLVIAFSALAVPAAALAGGWATAGLAPPPEELGPGDTWRAEITVLQHGVTPLDGVRPSVTLVDDVNGGRQTLPARPTDEPGVYAAEVVLPAAGSYRYEVDDGFGRVHTFTAFEVAPAGAGGSASLPGWGIGLIAAGGAILATAAALALRRRRTRLHAPVPALD